MPSPENKLVLNNLASGFRTSFEWVSQRDRQTGGIDLAATWVDIAAGGLQNIYLKGPPNVDHNEPFLPFVQAHRLQTEVFSVLRGGMRGGPSIDVLLQIWFDTEDMVGGFGVPLLIRRIPSAGAMPNAIFEELQETAKKLSIATPSTRIILFADQEDFDWGPAKITRHHPIIVVNAHTFASFLRPPHPISGRMLYHFADDLASGWVGDPALSGREKSLVMDEVLGTFTINHVLRVHIEKETSS